jgi:hypothetical protein
MSKRFILYLLITATLSFLLFFLWGYNRHSHLDPYSWANPGMETLESRDLWMQRRSLFIWSAAVAFALFCGLLVTLVLHIRREKKRSGESGSSPH